MENQEAKEVKKDCTNPFNEGVSYVEFLEAIGKKTIDEALKNVCTKEEIEFVKKEVELLKNK